MLVGQSKSSFSKTECLELQVLGPTLCEGPYEFGSVCPTYVHFLNQHFFLDWPIVEPMLCKGPMNLTLSVHRYIHFFITTLFSGLAHQYHSSQGGSSRPSFKAPHPPLTQLAPPFFKTLFPLPSFLFHPFSGILDSSPQPPATPSNPNPTNQPSLI